MIVITLNIHTKFIHNIALIASYLLCTLSRGRRNKYIKCCNDARTTHTHTRAWLVASKNKRWASTPDEWIDQWAGANAVGRLFLLLVCDFKQNSMRKLSSSSSFPSSGTTCSGWHGRASNTRRIRCISIRCVSRLNTWTELQIQYLHWWHRLVDHALVRLPFSPREHACECVCNERTPFKRHQLCCAVKT